MAFKPLPTEPAVAPGRLPDPMALCGTPGVWYSMLRRVSLIHCKGHQTLQVRFWPGVSRETLCTEMWSDGCSQMASSERDVVGSGINCLVSGRQSGRTELSWQREERPS